MKNFEVVNVEIEQINNLVFKPCKLELSSAAHDAESQEYGAHNLVLSGLNIKFRKAKITPAKIGQFVTIWKRNKHGITVPFDIEDNIDFFIIATRTQTCFGLFIFPKKVLHEHKIISDATHEGKRGIRVYPPWDLLTSKQAKQTQRWQVKYFLDISQENDFELARAKQLLAEIV